MAITKAPGPTFKITATTTYKLTNASDESAAGGVLIQIVDDNTLSASIVVKAQAHAIGAAPATDAPLAIPYRSLNVNGTAGTGAYVTTALTTNALIYVPSLGMDVFLDVTFVSGSATVYVTPVTGAASI